MKKYIFLFLLLMTSPLWAIETVFQAGGGNWSNAGNWSAGVPNGSDAVLNAGSGNCTLDVNSAAITALNMSGYTGTLDLTTNVIDVDGLVILDGTIEGTGGEIQCSGNFTKTASTLSMEDFTVTLNGTGNVTCNSVTGGNLVINTAGTHTATDAGLWTTFNAPSGIYAGGAYAHTIAGTLDIDSTSCTHTGTWTMTAAGTLDNDTGDKFAHLIIGDGATFTASLTDRVDIIKLSTDANSTVSSHQFDLVANDHNYIDIQGAFTSGLYIQPASRSNSGKITCGAFSMTSFNSTATFTGQVTCTSLKPFGNGNNRWSKMIFNGDNSSFGAITLGKTGTERAGRVDLGDNGHTHSITSVVNATGSTSSQLDFGTAIVTLSGTINGTGITSYTSAGAPRVSGGTISNVDLSGDTYLDARGVDSGSVTDGGGNSNVRFARGLVGGGVL